MNNKSKTLLVAALVAVVSSLGLNAQQFPEDITSQVSPKLLKVQNSSDVDVFTADGVLINSVEWFKEWDKGELSEDYYRTIYTAQREVILLDPGTGEPTVNRYQYDLQAKKTGSYAIDYIGHLRWWENGLRKHPGRAGWTYYGGAALAVAEQYGLNTEDSVAIGHYHWERINSGGTVINETRDNVQTYGFDLTQQSLSWETWAELQEFGDVFEVESLNPGAYNIVSFGDDMSGEIYISTIKVFREPN